MGIQAPVQVPVQPPVYSEKTKRSQTPNSSKEDMHRHYLNKLTQQPIATFSKDWFINFSKWLLTTFIGFLAIFGLNIIILLKSKTLYKELKAENYTLSYMFLSGCFLFSLMGVCMKMGYNEKPHRLNLKYQVVSFSGKLAYVVLYSSLLCGLIFDPFLMYYCSHKNKCG